MKSWRHRLLALFLGLVLAFIVGEGLVRALGLAPQLAAIEIDTAHGSFVSSPNPVLKYELKPGVGDVNAAGFRDRDYPIDKPAGTYRIVVLGDSVGFGYCNESRAIPLPRTFSEQLEEQLSRRPLSGFESVEVLNFSVSGYDTVQEVERLQHRALAYSPDLVLVAYCLNDMMLASYELHLFSQDEEWQAYRATADRLYRGAIFRSHLVRALWARAAGADRAASDASGEASTPGADRVAQAFDRLASLGGRHGFDSLVVVFPFFREIHRYPYQAQHEAVHAEARRAGIEVLDLLPVFQRLSRGNDDLCVPCCDIHPNERGHQAAAEAIARHLRRR